jgi:hypothetical protein
MVPPAPTMPSAEPSVVGASSVPAASLLPSGATYNASGSSSTLTLVPASVELSSGSFDGLGVGSGGSPLDAVACAGSEGCALGSLGVGVPGTGTLDPIGECGAELVAAPFVEPLPPATGPVGTVVGAEVLAEIEGAAALLSLVPELSSVERPVLEHAAHSAKSGKGRAMTDFTPALCAKRSNQITQSTRPRFSARIRNTPVRASAAAVGRRHDPVSKAKQPVR